MSTLRFWQSAGKVSPERGTKSDKIELIYIHGEIFPLISSFYFVSRNEKGARGKRMMMDQYLICKRRRKVIERWMHRWRAAGVRLRCRDDEKISQDWFCFPSSLFEPLHTKLLHARVQNKSDIKIYAPWLWSDSFRQELWIIATIRRSGTIFAVPRRDHAKLNCEQQSGSCTCKFNFTICCRLHTTPLPM